MKTIKEYSKSLNLYEIQINQSTKTFINNEDITT